MIHFLKLIRYQNLLMLALMQLIFRYGFLKSQNVPLALADWQYVLFVISTVCIAAAGYIINNIFDQDTDGENKPNNVIIGKQISESNAYNYYVALNIIGVGIGFYLSNVIQRPSFAAVFILIAATLYFYATSMKQSLLIGNIIIALLLSTSVLLIGVFNLLPATYEENRPVMAILFRILIDYAIFAFIINFIREIVKDLEDVNGDYNQGMSTLPIILGVARTSKIVFALSFIPIIAILYYINAYLFANGLLMSTIYGLIFILSPLLYFTVKIWSAEKPKDFNHLSVVLKWIMFFGILSILVINYNMKHHA
ncbi:geranylgeranylglycerol-phosphate geranylgeranyltransferase [Flavobacterium sp.]|uniref:geranylgeranylglycerol-phosphate geranylgeranyltransferase n=1 Tax=Flavobacterium sp. TaxID=239 RepID=UPI002B4ADD37|nr:geranylgeranylglycerol-phosphate geranylgeranyltransferase [Flavobacterium sp.]HLF51849.1 geranylgeranylglycerol-phosphate geranylgeranyltransferase [Flavobacterium sp.]